MNSAYGRTRYILIVCSMIPFIVLTFMGHEWAQTASLGYIPTAVFFGLLMAADYPPFGTKWFWETITPIVLVHFMIVLALVVLDVKFPWINKAPRMLYGAVGSLVFGEWRLAKLLIDALEPKRPLRT
jgi:hypothetical protein